MFDIGLFLASWILEKVEKITRYKQVYFTIMIITGKDRYFSVNSLMSILMPLGNEFKNGYVGLSRYRASI